MDGTSRWREGRKASWAGVALLLLAGLLAVAPQLLAQQPGDSSSQPDTSDQASSSTPASPPTQAVTTNLITGQAFKSLITPWHWGRLSLFSADFNYGYDTNVLLQQNSRISNTVYSARGLLVYSIEKPRSSLILQYAPSVFASDRVTQVSLLGHSLAFSSYRDLAPEWRLNVSDNFQYFPNQMRLFTPAFTQDFSSGTVTQQPLLAIGESYLTNNLGVSLTHQLSATDAISVQSAYTVSNTIYGNTGISSQQFPNLGQTVAFGVNWTHQWMETRQIGFTYQYARTVLGGPFGGSLYYSLLASYGQNLFPSLRMDLTYGPTIGFTQGSFGSGSPRTITQRTYQGSFSLQKTFERSAISLHFARSQVFSGIVSDTLNNRYDASYLRQFGVRWNMSMGASYLEQAWTTGGVTRGRGTWVEWSYRLSPSWSAVASYSYFDVRGTTAQAFNGLMVSVGVRWAWGSQNRPQGPTSNP
jgi:hypothetical protein